MGVSSASLEADARFDSRRAVIAAKTASTVSTASTRTTVRRRSRAGVRAIRLALPRPGRQAHGADVGDSLPRIADLRGSLEAELGPIWDGIVTAAGLETLSALVDSVLEAV